MDPARVDKVVESGGVVTDVEDGEVTVVGRMNFSWISVSNCFARQELGMVVMVGSIFLCAEAHKKKISLRQEVSAFGVVAPALIEESKALMAERHSIKRSARADDCLSKKIWLRRGGNRSTLQNSMADALLGALRLFTLLGVDTLDRLDQDGSFTLSAQSKMLSSN